MWPRASWTTFTSSLSPASLAKVWRRSRSVMESLPTVADALRATLWWRLGHSGSWTFFPSARARMMLRASRDRADCPLTAALRGSGGHVQERGDLVGAVREDLHPGQL